MTRLRLALVPGEPAGVGPELCARVLAQPHDCALVVYGDLQPIERAAQSLGIALPPIEAVEFPHPGRASAGHPEPGNAASLIEGLRAAAEACTRGDCDGLVTGPIHKATINAGGIAYTGTTELLAGWAGRDVVMMLANDIVRVALATTHLPLRAVPDAINAQSLQRTLHVLDEALREDFGIDAPRIAVLGLNPHAGEAGHLGREETEIIEPVVASLRAVGMQLSGPLPADTAFLPSKLRGFDAVLAMYHDQGLPVLKYSGFENAVNITLGLPYPRVAVDHGTALDIAGQGVADPSSLIAAITTCANMASRRAQRNQA